MKGTCALSANVCLLVSKQHQSCLLCVAFGRHWVNEGTEVDEIEDNPKNIVLFVSPLPDAQRRFCD